MSGLVTLGETMVALSPDRIGPLRHARSLNVSVAGSESTVAIGVARLGHPSTWIGRVGQDEFGSLVTATLAGEGVRTCAVVDAHAPTGLMVKEQRTGDLRRVQYYRDGSAGSRLRPEDAPADVVRSARVLHVSGITLALSSTSAAAVRGAVDLARASGVVVSFDLNHRAMLWTTERARTALREMLALADLVFASDDEARLVLDTDEPDPAVLAARLRDHGTSTAVVTLAAAGAVAVDPSGTVRATAPTVTEVDPLGAGDSFVAGYLAALLDGAAAPDRLTTAVAVAALSVGAHGDWEGLPTRAELGLVTAPGTVTR
ncbi:MAG: sugar kinase [Saccharothrix sp.]|nr:sugar kinase [Saccharothrix sp.]